MFPLPNPFPGVSIGIVVTLVFYYSGPFTFVITVIVLFGYSFVNYDSAVEFISTTDPFPVIP